MDKTWWIPAVGWDSAKCYVILSRLKVGTLVLCVFDHDKGGGE